MIMKGFITYKDGKNPFVLEKYELNLFSKDELLNAFIKEHNFKNSYILIGKYFRVWTTPENITLLIDHSIGTTCYVTCYILERFRIGSFCDNNISSKLYGDCDILFQKYDVVKYSSKILTNIGANPNNKINNSIPLGHLTNYS